MLTIEDFRKEIKVDNNNLFTVNENVCVVITKICGTFVESYGKISLEVILEDYDLMTLYKKYILNLDKSIHLNIEKINPKQQDEHSDFTNRFKCIISDESLLVFLKKVQLLSEKNYPIIGLPPSLTLALADEVLDALRFVLYLNGTIENKKNIYTLKVRMPNHILAMAFSGLFKKNNISPKIKDIKEQSILEIGDMSDIIKVFQIVEASGIAEKFKAHLEERD